MKHNSVRCYRNLINDDFSNNIVNTITSLIDKHLFKCFPDLTEGLRSDL